MNRIVRFTFTALLVLSVPMLTAVHGQSLPSGAKPSSGAAHGATKISFWQFFGGADGARIKRIVDDLNNSQQGVQNPLYVDMSTLTGGGPFYTKVHSAIASGDTPDFMTYDLSHLPTGVQSGDLRPLTKRELSTAGLKLSDFNPLVIKRSLVISSAYGQEGKLYGVPLDTDTLILAYNKNILQKAGLLRPNGKPKNLNGFQNFTNALKQIKVRTAMLPAAAFSTGDPASVWRIWFTLFKQLGGVLSENGIGVSMDDLSQQGKQALKDMVAWSTQGLIGHDPSDSAMVAQFTAGRTAFLIAGDWEVSTLQALQKKGNLSIAYGLIPFPKLYQNQETWADSHVLAVPNNTTNPISAQKLRDVFSIIAYLEHHSMIWAGGGHIPMYLPVADGSAFRHLVPNKEYSEQAAENAAYEPVNPIFGVGGPTYGAVGEYFTPALLGKSTVDKAMSNFASTLQSFLDLYG